MPMPTVTGVGRTTPTSATGIPTWWNWTGKKLGIIGRKHRTGDGAHRCRFRNAGMRLYFKPQSQLPEESGKWSWMSCSADDVVSLHCPLHPIPKSWSMPPAWPYETDGHSDKYRRGPLVNRRPGRRTEQGCDGGCRTGRAFFEPPNIPTPADGEELLHYAAYRLGHEKKPVSG